MKYRVLHGFFVAGAMFLASANAAPPKIYVSTGSGGTEFKNFEFSLNPGNTVLPGDPRLHRKALDEKAEQFRYGQFEVYIPVQDLGLPTKCKGFYIARMPQTLDLANTKEIKRKQALFFDIKRMVEERKGGIDIVLEYPVGCNIFFRSTADGSYVDYVGQLKK